MPTAHQPCGANGVQLSPPFEGSATATAIAIDDDQHRREPELEAGGDAQPERVRREHGGEHREPDERRDGGAAVGQVGDVVAADQRDGGRADEDGGDEPAAGDRRGGLADPGAHVGGDAAGDRVADTERGEGDRERGGEHDQRPPRRRSTRRPPPAPRARARAAGQARSGRRCRAHCPGRRRASPLKRNISSSG